MSADLAETLDPRLVGDRIAVHIARAVGADDCALSYWDQATRPGRHPRLRAARAAGAPERQLPPRRLSRRPAESSRSSARSSSTSTTAPPTPPRWRYLASIGQRTMAMIPLVAAGRTVGLIEVTSARRNAFDSRAVELAMMLAGEAAMALENARLYDEIRHQALHDGLTGLANRVLFRDRVELAVARSERSGAPIAVLFIDLDDFKIAQRHPRPRPRRRGARRRRAAGRRRPPAVRHGRPPWRRRVRGPDRGRRRRGRRAGGRDAPRRGAPPADADRPRRGPDRGQHRRRPRRRGDETADDLLRNADVAMYAAKGSSRGGAEIFRPALREGAAERAERAARLRGVEERDELRLDYQPIVELATNRIDGLEALVRWQPPDGPVLMPSDWIDLAEESGDIVPIGRWILREACRQARDWQIRLARPDLRISVNLSARQFREHDIVATVRAILDETGLPPRDADPRDHRERPDAADRRRRSPGSRRCARSASISRSTTSGPATRRSATSSGSRSTS